VSKSYKKFFDDYKEKMFLILTTKWPWYQPSEQAVFFFFAWFIENSPTQFVFHFTENSVIS
jgi:hypothetical protein